jgi:hypothetical protein
MFAAAVRRAAISARNSRCAARGKRARRETRRFSVIAPTRALRQAAGHRAICRRVCGCAMSRHARSGHRGEIYPSAGATKAGPEVAGAHRVKDQEREGRPFHPGRTPARLRPIMAAGERPLARSLQWLAETRNIEPDPRGRTTRGAKCNDRWYSFRPATAWLIAARFYRRRSLRYEVRQHRLGFSEHDARETFGFRFATAALHQAWRAAAVAALRPCGHGRINCFHLDQLA